MLPFRLVINVIVLLLACGTASHPVAYAEDRSENSNLKLSSREIPPDERARKIDELFSDWDTAETPGAVLAVIKAGQIIHQRAYGMADLERDVPLSLQSVFDIASTSKQFVAMSILLLQEKGSLSLEDDIRTYLPTFPNYGQTITVRHLIHHTSGIRDYMDLMELAGMKHENSYHSSVIIDLVARQEALNSIPGEEFLYSNSGYLLLADIINRASGQTLGEFTEQHIFKPLNMSVSHFYDDFKRIVRKRALSYSREGGNTFASIQYIFDVVGDTGLLTNIEDLFLWDQNFYDNRLGGGGPKLIEQLLTPGRLANGETLHYAFGLGLDRYRGLRVIKHGGSAAGYRSQMLRFPDQAFTVIILSNLAEFSPTHLAEQVADLYLAEDYTASPSPTKTGSVDPIAARTQTEVNISASELKAYSGRYYSGELGTTYIFRIVDGKLTYHLEHSPVEIQLVPTGRDEWKADHLNVRFLRNRTEMIDGLSVSIYRIRNIEFKKNRP